MMPEASSHPHRHLKPERFKFLLGDATTARGFFEGLTRAETWDPFFHVCLLHQNGGAPGLRGCSSVVFSSQPIVQHSTWHRADFLYELVE